MGLVPHLVGGITIRERRKRYDGEPRYKRIDFVRPRKLSNGMEDWDTIKTPEPVQANQEPATSQIWGCNTHLAHNPEHVQNYYHSDGAYGVHAWYTPSDRFLPWHWHSPGSLEPEFGHYPEAFDAIEPHGHKTNLYDKELSPAFKEIEPKPERRKKVGCDGKPHEQPGHSIFEDSSCDKEVHGHQCYNHRPSKTRGRSKSKHLRDKDTYPRSPIRFRGW